MIAKVLLNRRVNLVGQFVSEIYCKILKVWKVGIKTAFILLKKVERGDSVFGAGHCQQSLTSLTFFCFLCNRGENVNLQSCNSSKL